MAATSVGSTYGDALFEIAQERGALTAFEQQLTDVLSLFVAGSDFETFLYSPVVPRTAKCELLQQLWASEVAPEVLHFLYVMVERGRTRAIPAAIRHFVQRSEEARGILRAVVYTAHPLTEVQRTTLRTKLEQDTGKTILLSEEARPDLMGGLVVEMGDERIDMSVRRRLEDLARALHNDASSLRN